MYAGGQQPIFILKEGTSQSRGRGAQSNNIAAAKAVADAVRSTLGPKGMDKMLVDSMGDVVITNDGATILKEMDIEHPAAKMIIEVAKTIDDPSKVEELISKIEGEKKKEPIELRRGGMITFFVGIGLYLFGVVALGSILKGVGLLVGTIGVGTFIAGYLFPNDSTGITKAVEEFEKE